MKLLLAIDGSACSRYAAEFLCRLPHDDALEVEVISSINAPDVSTSTSTKAWLPQYLEQLEADADAAYQHVVQCFEGSTAKLSYFKTQGHPGHQIVNRAEETGAKLIVLGAKGHSTAVRMLLGSVSDYVGRHAKTSVLTVRPPADGEPPERLRVTIAYDDSPPSQRALDDFQAFSWSGGVDVEVVSVVHLFPRFPGEGEELLQDQVRHDSEVAQSKLDEIVSRLSSQHVHATSRVVTGDHAGETILEAARDFGSQLIVLGNTGRSLIPRLLLGSVSSYVLRHADQSVWIAR